MMMLRSRLARTLSTQPLARTLSTQPLGRTLSTNPSWPLAGKTIVVAGAGNPPAEGHGIGAMTSIVLARQGANVVSVSNEALNCQTVTDAIVAEGLEGIAHVADCTKGGDVEGLVAATVAKYGRCDAVINAGIHSALPMGFGKMTEEAWAKGIDLNLNAHFHLIHKFLPVFESQQGGCADVGRVEAEELLRGGSAAEGGRQALERQLQGGQREPRERQREHSCV